MAKRTAKRTTKSTKSKVTRTTNRKSMIGKPSSPFYIDDVRPLI